MKTKCITASIKQLCFQAQQELHQNLFKLQGMSYQKNHLKLQNPQQTREHKGCKNLQKD